MKSRGFTLIELLVVIAVIGILASVVMASLNSARAKARDARRQANSDSIRTALQLYYDDNGSFPLCGTYENAGDPVYGGFVTRSYDAEWDGCLGVKLKPYLSVMPNDVNTNINSLPLYYWYDCLAPSSSALTCGGVLFNIYFETRTPNMLNWKIE